MSENKQIGPVIMACVIAIATPLFIPGSLMTIGTGFIMHQVYKDDDEQVWKSIVVGTLIVYLGTWLGSCLSFFLGRYVLRDMTERLNKRFLMMRALDRAMKE